MTPEITTAIAGLIDTITWGLWIGGFLAVMWWLDR